MGFDDILWDNDIKEKTKEILRPLIGKYDHEDWDDLEGMETGEKVYSAYSLIYKQIHAINYTMMVGASPFAPTPEMKERVVKNTREEVLQLFLEEMDFINDVEILRKIAKNL